MDKMVHQAPAHDGKAWRQGLAFWLLLLSIFTHAIVPAGSPLHRTPGSAFSATTAEVAIAPKRKSSASEPAQAGASDEGDSNGSGAAGDPPVQSLGAAALPAWSAEPATGPWAAIPSRRAVDGAAAFSARAPPSL